MQQVGKWNRAQRNDVILDALLKDLGERFSLVHYPRIGKRTVEHALVHPGGVLTITARDLPGGVAYRDGRWRKVGQGISRFFGMGGAFLGNPTADTAADIDAVNALLAAEQSKSETRCRRAGISSDKRGRPQAVHRVVASRCRTASGGAAASR